MTLHYEIEVQAGPSYYSEKYDEEFYDTDTKEVDLEISDEEAGNAYFQLTMEKDFNKAIAHIIQDWLDNDNMTDEQFKEILLEFNSTTMEEAVEQALKSIEKRNIRRYRSGMDLIKITPHTVLDELTGDASSYYNEEDLKYWFLDEAFRKL